MELSRGYSAPVFAPHVTMAGGIQGPAREVISKMKRLAKQITPFGVRLTQADFLDEYYRCLFIRVAKTQPIMEANKLAREVFGLHDPCAFMPHLSLLYGNLPSSAKERIITSLGRQFELEFKVSSLHLYLTKGAPMGWRRMGRVGLKL